ncbi:MAG: triose-phosphate isomerase, partial [Myxococcota bacterium]
MRTLIVANWKMNMNLGEVEAFTERLLSLLAEGAGAATEPEVAIAPPYTALATLASALSGSSIALAAQDVSVHSSGAFTGEVAADMLADIGCRYGLVGHSERRQLWSESSEDVSRKAKALLQAGVTPIVCIGETREEREASRTAEIVLEQLQSSLPPA